MKIYSVNANFTICFFKLFRFSILLALKKLSGVKFNTDIKLHLEKSKLKQVENVIISDNKTDQEEAESDNSLLQQR